jgi:hypothetical protein
MPWIASTSVAQKVPQADAGGEAPAAPQVTDIPTNGFTMPITTNHLESVTVTVQPSANAGSAEIYGRDGDDGAWYLLTTIDTSGGTASERLVGPVSQIRVKILVVATAKVFVQGIAANRT